MTSTTVNPNETVRKAAILVRSLDPDAVASLLARMSPAEAKAIRMAVRELNEVTEDERREVLEELRREPVSQSPSYQSQDLRDHGIEVQFSSRPAPTSTTRSMDHSPRQRLVEADAKALVAFLQVEQPATVAVVLSCLPASRAAAVLDALPPGLQSQAMRRLAELGDIDPDSLNVITAELEAWIARHTQDQRREEDRRSMLRAILDASSPDTRGRIANELRDTIGELQTCDKEVAPEPISPHAPRIAEQLASNQPTPTPAPPKPAPKPRYPFNQLESLPASALASVLRRVDRETLVLALVGASDRLLTRLRKMANRKQWKAIEQSIARVGPLKLRDIQHAQDLVSLAASDLSPAKGAA